MFWEKKEKEQGLPDLPSLPARSSIPPREFSPPEMDEDVISPDIHELPSFPDSPLKRGFSQSAIKDAVTSEEIKESESFYPQPSNRPSYKFVEMDDWQNPPAETTRIPAPRAMSPSAPRDNKPIFIRIDKFQLARSTLETVKSKLNEIEELLKTIRDVKAKEDTELSSWESELENVKSRVQNVLTDIFERVEN